MRPIIYPYKMASDSAKALQKELISRGQRAIRVHPDGRYKPYPNHLIINWGSSRLPPWFTNHKGMWLNDPFNVLTATNKLLTFQILKANNISIPEFTTDRMYAVDNWMSNNLPFFVRTDLAGHSGKGMYYIPEGTDSLADLHGKLYVKYIKKHSEYRVHVFRGRVIDVQIKRKRINNNTDEVNYKIRNLAGGWVFCRQDVIIPSESILNDAVQAVNALGLDFGAADIIWNNHYHTAYVLEVNTAPGLEGATINNYVDAIERIL